MHSSSENAISHSSLSDTFAATDSLPEGTKDKANELAGLKKSIRQLKAIMLSLEWDLSLDTLQQLDTEIAAQENRWQEDKNVTGLLRILRALGNYIGRMQALTHPLAIKLFFAVYNGLERIVLSPGLSAGKRKKIVLLAYQRYNEVKDQLALREKLIAQQKAKAVTLEGDGATIGRTGEERSGETDSLLDDLTGEQPGTIPASHAEEVVGPEAPAEAIGPTDDLADDEMNVIPALGDVDLSGEDKEKRRSWLESEAPGDLTSRLSSFFDEKNEDSALPLKTGTEKEDASEAPATDAAKKGVIDELFQQQSDESPADQLLTDMHLSVFAPDADGEAIPSTVPLSGQPQEDLSVQQDESQVDIQVTEKLDAFFDESKPDEGLPLKEEQTGVSEESEESVEKGSEVAFANDLETRLDSFFDGDEQSEVHPDSSEVVPLQSTAKPAEKKTGDLLDELLNEIKQLSGDYRHLPESEEKELLSSLFERAEMACQEKQEVLIPLYLLQASLFSFYGAKEQTLTEALESAADLSRLILQLAGGNQIENRDFVNIASCLKRFLRLIASSDRPCSLEKEAAGNRDDAGGGGRDDLSSLPKKSQEDDQFRSNGDLIIEDLFSEE